ncbi:hypothetical protein [Mesorhizobium kowhaii]|nr:hypothetical protein [Mesorhizobium kowhaii]
MIIRPWLTIRRKHLKDASSVLQLTNGIASRKVSLSQVVISDWHSQGRVTLQPNQVERS